LVAQFPVKKGTSLKLTKIFPIQFRTKIIKNFAKFNNWWLKNHGIFFCKKQITRKNFLRGACRRREYPYYKCWWNNLGIAQFLFAFDFEIFYYSDNYRKKVRREKLSEYGRYYAQFLTFPGINSDEKEGQWRD
jgi:hypothetical protein